MVSSGKNLNNGMLVGLLTKIMAGGEVCALCPQAVKYIFCPLVDFAGAGATHLCKDLLIRERVTANQHTLLRRSEKPN